MKATSTAPQTNEHPPLARDAQGNLLSVPDGTCAWRICRHTKGRPRIINGPDKQPARFPLDITADEIADSCGADTYRVYALDDVGNVIDYVTTIETARELRNAAEPEVAVVPTPRAAVGTGDLRYALEAVAHMARTNADAMRAVAESQADWIKSISSARGFFRNAPAQIQSPTEPENEEETEEEEFDLKTSWIEQLQPVIGVVVQQIISALMAPKSDEGGTKLQLADLLDWRRGSRKHAQKADAVALPEATISPQALQTALAGRAIAVAPLLEPTEQARLLKLAPMLSKLAADPEISGLLAELVAMSTEDAVTWIRSHLDEIEKGLAS